MPHAADTLSRYCPCGGTTWRPSSRAMTRVAVLFMGAVVGSVLVFVGLMMPILLFGLPIVALVCLVLLVAAPRVYTCTGCGATEYEATLRTREPLGEGEVQPTFVTGPRLRSVRPPDYPDGRREPEV